MFQLNDHPRPAARMYCIECGKSLPDVRDSSTVCSNCKTPVATWWDEATQTPRTHREALLPFTVTPQPGENDTMSRRRNTQSIEERSFQAALICLEQHFEKLAGLGPKTLPEVKAMVRTTLEQSLNKADVRERLAKNVDIWMRLRKIFMLAVRTLEKRSLRDPYVENGLPAGGDAPQNSSLILKHYDELVQDLNFLNNLLVISRNMLAIKETAQELCAAVYFDKAVQELIVLCVNVTSKGYDGENVNEVNRGKLNDVTELYKKLLVTALQHTHNWTMGNDRFKMSFWWNMLFDDDLRNDPVQDQPPDDLDVQKAFDEVRNWLRRNSQRDKAAAEILDRYSADVQLGNTPGPLLKDEMEDEFPEATTTEGPSSPIWMPELEDKYEQDRLYARVSHEIDVWWKRVRDANYEGWVVPMESVEGAIARAELCKSNAMNRYMPQGTDPDQKSDNEENYEEQTEDDEFNDEGVLDDRSTTGENGDEEGEEDEDDEDDDESYMEGPLRGLLTELPNILDTKQIEALHMTIKACIVDSMGSGLTPAGENLQKTRCKMFLALDCGKNLLREMLVFIAVWEQTDQQFIFQITAQIVESFHHNALLPYAWNSLRILKDIVSPAQTVLLRLINYMFRARKESPIYDDLRDYNRDAKLIHFLYNYFRCRVVPDCIALIHAQAQIRQEKRLPIDFPVDLWDMERAKDGLSQYLDFIAVIAEIPEMRPLLIEWEAVYELIALLKALEAGVARKSIDERQVPQPSRYMPPNGNGAPGPDGQPSATQEPIPSATPAVYDTSHNTPHKFPWAGIKIQILIILTSLVAPSNPRRSGPGNPIVQKQLLEREGIMPLLNCCVYDGHNEYLKERATLAIRYVMEGCEEAQKFVRELVPVKHAQALAQAHAQALAQRSQLPDELARNLAEQRALMAQRKEGAISPSQLQPQGKIQPQMAIPATTPAAIRTHATAPSGSAPLREQTAAPAAAEMAKAEVETMAAEKSAKASEESSKGSEEKEYRTLSVSAAEGIEKKLKQLRNVGTPAEQGRHILEEAKEMLMAQSRGQELDLEEVDKMVYIVQCMKEGAEAKAKEKVNEKGEKEKGEEEVKEEKEKEKETKAQRKQRLMLEALEKGEGI